MPKDIDKINEILKNNSDKNFIQRIIKPEDSPKLDLGSGNYATHKMAYGEMDGKFLVFPTVMQERDGRLKDYGESAFNEAIRRGEFVEFNNEDEASWFSKNYKNVWKKSTEDILYGGGD